MQVCRLMSGIEKDAARLPDALWVNMPRKVEGIGRQLSRSIRTGWKEEGSLSGRGHKEGAPHSAWRRRRDGSIWGCIVKGGRPTS